MRRIQPSAKSFLPPTVKTDFDVESALFSTRCDETAHALFAPLHYEPRYRYPLIVWLHGRGSDERQLLRVMPLVSMRNYVAVAPRGFCLDGEGSGGAVGYGWRQSDEQIQQAEQRVWDSMEIAAGKYHIGPGRVFLAGFDCGGTMAFRLAMNRPDRFAGVLSLCGAFPTSRTPLGNLVAARRLPMFLAVGRRSREYPAAEVCANLRLLHSAGMSITLREYPCGHELTLQMLADVDRWIMEQITAGGPAAAPPDRQWSCEAE
jgi:phospholipase/carboxylesterase